MTHLNHRQQACEVVETARQMNALGINHNKSGNVSVRVAAIGIAGDADITGEADFLITPTGIAYDDLQAEQVVAMRCDGAFTGTLLPSSEWRFHADIYGQRADVTAIVHTHSAFATTLACHGRDIPAFHYMVAAAGGKDIRCAPYATFGTQQLSDHALVALTGRKACLLAHHGVIATGASLAAALALAVKVERLAQMYWQALQLGEPPLLPDDEMAVVLQKFRHYGQQPEESSAMPNRVIQTM